MKIIEKNWLQFTISKTENVVDIEWNEFTVKKFECETTLDKEIEKQEKFDMAFNEAKSRKEEQDALVIEMVKKSKTP